MTASEFPVGPGSPAWQRYLAHEQAARNAYLSTVGHAHREYLTGPWPDRESYNAVEGSAWRTYYAAGRAAWITYRQEVEVPPPPPQHTAAGTSYPPERISGPDFSGWQPGQPTFSPNQESR